MYRYLILIIIVVMCSERCSYAQNNMNMIEILNVEQDIINLENRIKNVIKKNHPNLANIQGLQQFHILTLSANSKNKEDYLNGSFLDQIIPDYWLLSSKVKKYKSLQRSFLYRIIGPRFYLNRYSKPPVKRQKYLVTNTLITDSIGNLIAVGDARLVQVLYDFNPSYAKLAKMFFNKEIDFAFYLDGSAGRYMVGIKNDRLYAFMTTKTHLNIYIWEEFIECCFNEWVGNVSN